MVVLYCPKVFQGQLNTAQAMLPFENSDAWGAIPLAMPFSLVPANWGSPSGIIATLPATQSVLASNRKINTWLGSKRNAFSNEHRFNSVAFPLSVREVVHLI